MSGVSSSVLWQCDASVVKLFKEATLKMPENDSAYLLGLLDSAIGL